MWLNADQLSPYDYWQFWRNTADADVGKFLKLFTDLPLRRDRRTCEASKAQAINDAKIVLANAATAMLHGDEAAAKRASDRRDDLRRAARARTCRRFASADGDDRSSQALTGLGFAASNGEARRKIAEGAVRLERRRGRAIRRWSSRRRPTKLSLGKKKHGLLVEA